MLLLDEPTNHLDLDTIEWLEGYLQKQEVPMVIISHDRAFLDQLCTKIVETEMGVSRTFEGNYSQYVISKAEWIETQNAAWEKQQREIESTKDLIARLGAGANSGRASTAEKVSKQAKLIIAVISKFELMFPLFVFVIETREAARAGAYREAFPEEADEDQVS